MKSIFYKYPLLTLFALCFGCVKSVEEIASSPNLPSSQFTEFVIVRGDHYSNGTYAEITGSELAFEAIFDSTSIYNTKHDENAGDINKLYGFSDCNTRHQENSARVGWVWDGGSIQLFAYCYSNGERSSRLIGTAAIGEVLSLSISVSSSAYLFTYKGEKTNMKRHCSAPGINGYMLYPYFGGDETAPHDIRIRIRHVSGSN